MLKIMKIKIDLKTIYTLARFFKDYDEFRSYLSNKYFGIPTTTTKCLDVELDGYLQMAGDNKNNINERG